MSENNDTLSVFIGRFQPFHNGHRQVILNGLDTSDKVVVFIGSSFGTPSPRNPFNHQLVTLMIKRDLQQYVDQGRLILIPIEDHPYNQSLWIESIQNHVRSIQPNDKVISLIGYDKDHTSFYLKLFPKWSSLSVRPVMMFDSLIDAKNIRRTLFDWSSVEAAREAQQRFDNFTPKIFEDLIPYSTMEIIEQYTHTKQYIEMVEEYIHDREYKKQWPNDPHVTVDAVCVQAGHILLIKRKFAPGKGQWALPGGFVNRDEALEDACIRELREEATIDVPPAVLKSRIVADKYFAHPFRSTRARIITFAFMFDLNDELNRKSSRNIIKAPLGLTGVKANDDASEAKWFALSDIKREMLFEDHYDIIRTMIRG